MSVLRRFNTAELVLTQRQALERPLLALVLLGTLSFAVAAGEAGYLLLILLGVGINALALRLRSEICLPRFVVNAAVVLATLFAARDAMRTPLLFTTLGHYLVLILFCKLFEQKRNRDYGQIIAISIVLVLDSALLTTGMWFGLVLLLFVPLSCYVAMILTLKISLDRQARAVLSAEQAPVDPRRLVWNMSGPFPRQALRRWTAYATIGGLVTAVVVFLVMPRVQPGSLFGLGRIPYGGVHTTGFSNQSMNLLDVGTITADRRVVMDVKLSNPAGDNLGRAGEGLYLRGAVYGRYSEGRWNVLDRQRLWLRASGFADAPTEVIQRVTMDQSLLPSLFAIFPSPDIEEVDEGTLSTMNPDLPGTPAVPAGGVRYIAHSWRPPFTSIQRQHIREMGGQSRLNRRDIQREPVSPRVAELARSWCQDLLDQRRGPGEAEADKLNLAIAARLVERLRDGYTYTLDLSAMRPDRDPVDQFLFETRQGHCEFFASAMTLMARSLGLDARMVGGFLADDYSPTTKSYTVRASDAHAWVEVYTYADDWTVFDPTPPGGRQAVQTGPKGKQAQDLWNRIGFLWNTRVLGYGEADRQNLFGRVLTWFHEGGRRAGNAVRHAAEDLWRMARTGKWNWSALLAALPGVAVVGVLLTLVLLARLLRRWRLRRAERADLRTMPAFYRRLARLLKRRGLPQQRAQTAQEYLLEAQRRYNLPARSVRIVVAVAYRQRWAGAPPRSDQTAMAKAAVEDIRRHLRVSRVAKGK